MKKSVWLINQYATTPETGMGGRHHNIATELGKRGFDVTLIAARWHHQIINQEFAAKAPTNEEREFYRFVRIDVPKYSNARSIGRIFNWFLFSFRLFRIDRNRYSVPEVIVYSSPALIGYLSAEHLARRFDAKLIFEIRDIWPLTFIELGGFNKYNPFVLFNQWIEDRALRKSDHVVSNLPNAQQHLVERGVVGDNFTWIPNGVDDAEYAMELPLNTIGSTKKEFKVGYTGSLGFANNIDIFLSAAELLKNERNIQFEIFGQGEYEDAIRNRIQRMELRNVKFFGKLERAKIPEIQRRFDIAFLGLRKSKLFRFGISPNKLFEYFAAGCPTIIASDSATYDQNRFVGASVRVDPNNPIELAEAIKRIVYNRRLHKFMSDRARKAVQERYSVNAITSRYVELLNSLANW